MGLLGEKEPLLEGRAKSATVALPEALWEAIDKEVVIEDAKSRSKFVTECLVFAIKALREKRTKK
jgi:metal-responsive CopG/Arc/MetJ family transcriptional regulator